MRWPAALLGVGLLAVVDANGYGASPRFAIYGVNSLEAFAVALLLPLLSGWRNGGVFDCPVRRLSLVTYALYLVHLPLLYLFGSLVPDPVAWVCAAHYALFLATALALAALTHHFWERPFMRLRNPLGRWLAARWPVR